MFETFQACRHDLFACKTFCKDKVAALLQLHRLAGQPLVPASKLKKQHRGSSTEIKVQTHYSIPHILTFQDYRATLANESTILDILQVETTP